MSSQEKFEVGPFTMADTDTLSQELQKNNIEFEIIKDEDLLDQQTQEHNAQMTDGAQIASNRFTPRFLFFELSTLDISKVEPILEKYGIILNPVEVE